LHDDNDNEEENHVFFIIFFQEAPQAAIGILSEAQLAEVRSEADEATGAVGWMAQFARELVAAHRDDGDGGDGGEGGDAPVAAGDLHDGAGAKSVTFSSLGNLEDDT